MSSSEMHQADIILYRIKQQEDNLETLGVDRKYWSYTVRNTMPEEDGSHLGGVDVTRECALAIVEDLRECSWQPKPGQTVNECLVVDGRDHDLVVALTRLEEGEEDELRQALFKQYGPSQSDVSIPVSQSELSVHEQVLSHLERGNYRDCPRLVANHWNSFGPIKQQQIQARLEQHEETLIDDANKEMRNSVYGGGSLSCIQIDKDSVDMADKRYKVESMIITLNPMDYSSVLQLRCVLDMLIFIQSYQNLLYHR
jgi:hypothetical protein